MQDVVLFSLSAVTLRPSTTVLTVNRIGGFFPMQLNKFPLVDTVSIGGRVHGFRLLNELLFCFCVELGNRLLFLFATVLYPYL